MVDYTNVSARAMLVSLQISMWTGFKIDKGATRKVNEDHAASDKAGRYNKQLLPGAKVHEDLNKRSALARDVHYRMTLPWADDGWRLLPTANYFQYAEAMRAQFHLLDALKQEFIATYPQLVDAARAAHTALGRLFNHADYPTQRRLASKFSWSLEFQPVPSAHDIRVDLPSDQLATIEQQITSRVERAAKDAMATAYQRLYDAVARVHKASATDGVVRNNLIDHVRDVVDVLGRLNVAQDEHLDALRERVERELTTIAVDDLRKDDAVRVDTRQRAETIMAAMSAFYTPAAASDDDDKEAA